MIDVHMVNQEKQRKYIDSYNTKEKKNDWCARCKQKKKKKKYIDSYVHAVNKKKQRFNQPITLTSHLIWFVFSVWNIFCQAHITPKSPTSILFCLFILQFVIKGKARQVPFVFLFLLLCWRIRIASPHNIILRLFSYSFTLLQCSQLRIVSFLLM